MNTPAYSFGDVVPSFFHIVDRYCDTSWYVPPSPHDFHNFMLVVSGEGTSLTDGARYPMRPGMLVYHHCGQSYGFETSQTCLMHSFGINFHLAAASHNSGAWTLSAVERLPFDNFMHMPNTDILIKYFTDLVDVWDEAKKNSQLKLRSIFLNILYEVSNQLAAQQGNSKTVTSIDHVVLYIRRHYKEHMTLQFLAGLAGLNPNYFSGVFKQNTGMTPVEYVNSVRVEKAEEYLGIGYSISETSSAVGFSDPFYFSKVFKKYKGISPKEFAKMPLFYC